MTTMPVECPLCGFTWEIDVFIDLYITCPRCGQYGKLRKVKEAEILTIIS